MKGDFSRITFDRTKHYSGVYPEQGRVLTDADFGEEHDIQQYRSEVTAADVIGQSGTPKFDPGFTLTVVAQTLMIGRGDYYIDGVLFENESQVAHESQPHLPNLPATARVANVLSPAGPRVAIVYLDGFRREVTALDDLRLRESALTGPDTSIRAQVVWQVGVLPLGVNLSDAARSVLTVLTQQLRLLETQLAAATTETIKRNIRRQMKGVQRQIETQAAGAALTCATAFPEWRRLTRPRSPAPALTVRTPPTSANDDPCSAPPGAGYLSGENQFYRVEVHSVGNTGQRNTATIKWSRENGFVTALIEAVGNVTTGTVSANQVRVNSTGRDGFLGFETGNWVEYVDDEIELKGLPGTLAQITDADEATNIIRLSGSIPVNFSLHPKLRRWDQIGVSATANGVAMNTTDNAFVGLERNVQVSFADGIYRPGDYWVFAARADTGAVEFPATAQPPAGVRHHYARLGLIFLDSANAVQMLLDCRELLPPLTGLAAEDVAYDNSECADLAQARTVQEALDVLCRQGGDGLCTFTASPGDGWQTIFDAVREGQDAQICFPVGEYPLRETAVVTGKGHLQLVGAGPGTRIVAATAGSALRFENCGKVTVRDLSAESGGMAARRARDTAVPDDDPPSALNGTLSFRDCESVDVEHVVLKCASGLRRSTACLAVRNQPPDPNRSSPPRTVRVQHCELSVGNLQTGVLLVNVSRSHVEDNVVRAYPLPPELTFHRMLENLETRAGIRRAFIAGAFPGDVPPEARRGALNVRLTAGDHVILFRSQIGDDAAWSALLAGSAPTDKINSNRALLEHMLKAVKRVLVDVNFRNRFRAFRDLYNDLAARGNTGIASQGITVGGRTAGEVRILNNTVAGVLQGVHVGLSLERRADETSEEARGVHREAGVVTISGNTVACILPPEAGNLERHGIFVGNCRNLLIENNDVSLSRLARADELLIDGIKVLGFMGNRLMVTQNHVHSVDDNSNASFNVGIRVNPLAESKPNKAQWLVMYNVAPSISATLNLTHAQQVPGTNLP
jgi:hypothetical protein